MVHLYGMTILGLAVAAQKCETPASESADDERMLFYEFFFFFFFLPRCNICVYIKFESICTDLGIYNVC